MKEKNENKHTLSFGLSQMGKILLSKVRETNRPGMLEEMAALYGWVKSGGDIVPFVAEIKKKGTENDGNRKET